jgi:methionyl-tRNA formyltransferase
VAPALRIAFLGNDAWSVPSLRAIAASPHTVALVATRAPRPAGRGNRLTPTPVALAARELELPLAEVETVRAGPGLRTLAASRPDVLVVVAYGEILPPEVLALPRLLPVNLHFSLLPELRGAAPVQAALLLGLPETGVTTIVMEEGLDSGPILVQRSARVLPEDDAGSLGSRLAELGAEVLLETLDLIASDRAVPVPQDDRAATVAPKLGPRDRRLDWSGSARELVNRIRALAPEPGAVATFRGANLKVLRAEAIERPTRLDPGTVTEVDRGGFAVATGEGELRPIELAPAGRRRMTAAEFVRGHRPVVGERLS